MQNLFLLFSLQVLIINPEYLTISGHLPSKKITSIRSLHTRTYHSSSSQSLEQCLITKRRSHFKEGENQIACLEKINHQEQKSEQFTSTYWQAASVHRCTRECIEL